MRRAILLALMTALLVSGCSGPAGQEQRLEARREELTAAGEISFTAAMSVDLGDRVFDCVMDCVCTPEQTEISVIEPQEAAGVTARVGPDGTEAEYDSLRLDIGRTATESPGPVEAAALIAEAVFSGHVTQLFTESGEDGRLLAARSYISEEAYALIRYEYTTLTPVYAELVYGGSALVTCEISDFS